MFKQIGIIVSYFFITFFFCYNAKISYAKVTLFDPSKLNSQYCQNMSSENKKIISRKLTGLARNGGCLGEDILCQIEFKLDTNQNYDYIPLHKAYELDDFLLFSILPKYRDVAFEKATPVVVKMDRTIEIDDYGGCDISDQIVSIKVIK